MSSKRRSRAAATLEAGVAASLVLGKLSCPAGSPSPSPQGQAASVTVPPAPRESEALPLLRKDVVLHTAPARRRLFTWTTRDQIVELARDKVLLTRTVSPIHGPAYYDQVVADRAAAGDALAQKLHTAVFARSRFAWPSPWPTLQGWPGETYGEELIAVALKAEAWTLKLSTSKPGWEAFDLDNRPVAIADVLLHPERIGAVYFVHDSPARGYARTNAGPAERAAYREYVLCNEAMIESWSIGDKLNAVTIEASANAMERLAAELPSRAPRPPSVEAWNAEVATAVWPGPEAIAALDQTYEAAISFPNENYLLTPENIRALARRLRGITVREPSLVHFPTVSPAAVATASASARPLPPPVPTVRKRRGTAMWRGTH